MSDEPGLSLPDDYTPVPNPKPTPPGPVLIPKAAQEILDHTLIMPSGAPVPDGYEGARRALAAIDRGEGLAFNDIPSLKELPGINDLPFRTPTLYNDPSLRKSCRKAAYPYGEEELLAIARMWKFALVMGRQASYITAPQMGIPLRIVCIRVDGRYATIVNPEILERSGGEITHGQEECWSLATGRNIVRVDVKRDSMVRVRGNDGVKGGVVSGWLCNSPAYYMQHAVDHLDGKLISDALSGIKLNLVAEKLRRIDKTGRRNQKG